MNVSMGKKNEPATTGAASAERPKESTKPIATAAVIAPVTTNGDGARPKASVKKKPAKAALKKQPATFSAEDIALRAYYIAEHRQRHGIHGDEQGDWIEAERQLRAEAKKKTAAKKTATAKKRE